MDTENVNEKVNRMVDCERKFALLLQSVEIRGKLLGIITLREVATLRQARKTMETTRREYAYPYSTQAEWNVFRDTFIRVSSDVSELVIRVLNDINLIKDIQSSQD